ncbi:MAG: hypothetical protein RLZ39_1661 [Bacteroidota bacterium]|jgi:hypothetical protein
MKPLDFIKFFFISVPLACVLFVTANFYFELKRLKLRWQKR